MHNDEAAATSTSSSPKATPKATSKQAAGSSKSTAAKKVVQKKTTDAPTAVAPKPDPVTNVHAPKAAVVQHVGKQTAPSVRYQALELAIKHYEGTANGWQDVINLAFHFEDYLKGKLPEQQELAPSPNATKSPTKSAKGSTKPGDRAEYIEDEDTESEEYGDDEYPYDGYDDVE
jgi:hypothetical protein